MNRIFNSVKTIRKRIFQRKIEKESTLARLKFEKQLQAITPNLFLPDAFASEFLIIFTNNERELSQISEIAAKLKSELSCSVLIFTDQPVVQKYTQRIYFVPAYLLTDSDLQSTCKYLANTISPSSEVIGFWNTSGIFPTLVKRPDISTFMNQEDLYKGLTDGLMSHPRVRKSDISLNLRVNIVDYESSPEAGNSWILSQFSSNLAFGLSQLGVSVTVSPKPLMGFDITHHIPYLSPVIENFVDGTHSVMVTHIDNENKLKIIERQLHSGISLVCMSSETAGQILFLFGEDYSKQVFVALPPAVRELEVAPVRIALFSRLYSDGRKNEGDLLNLFNAFNPSAVSLQIMGEGWGEICDVLSSRGFEVTYSESFDLEKYRLWISSADFTIYFGRDEGAMSFLDALQVGKKVIVPPVGYHLDFAHPNVYLADNLLEMTSVIQQEVSLRYSAHALVTNNTWLKYAESHLNAWQE